MLGKNGYSCPGMFPVFCEGEVKVIPDHYGESEFITLHPNSRTLKFISRRKEGRLTTPSFLPSFPRTPITCRSPICKYVSNIVNLILFKQKFDNKHKPFALKPSIRQECPEKGPIPAWTGIRIGATTNKPQPPKWTPNTQKPRKAG